MTYRDLLIAILLLGFFSIVLMNPDLFRKDTDHAAILLLNGEAMDLNEPLPLDTQGALGIILVHEKEQLTAGKLSPGFNVVLERQSRPVGKPLRIKSLESIGGLRIENLIRGARSGDRLLMEVTHLKRKLRYNIPLR